MHTSTRRSSLIRRSGVRELASRAAVTEATRAAKSAGLNTGSLSSPPPLSDSPSPPPRGAACRPPGRPRDTSSPDAAVEAHRRREASRRGPLHLESWHGPSASCFGSMGSRSQVRPRGSSAFPALARRALPSGAEGQQRPNHLDAVWPNRTGPSLPEANSLTARGSSGRSRRQTDPSRLERRKPGGTRLRLLAGAHRVPVRATQPDPLW